MGRVSEGTVTGDIRVNNRKRDATWLKMAAYVEQDDLHYPHMTVREIVAFAAHTRLPRHMPARTKLARADEVIRELGIAHCADRIVGSPLLAGSVIPPGISCGERKRLSIAVELVTNPRVLFLDEPTSGLDAYTSKALAESLLRLAVEKRRTIIATIHQPRTSIMRLVSRIILLSRGKIVFSGTVNEAYTYFAGLGYPIPDMTNPGDFLMDTTAIDYRSSEKYTESRNRVDSLIKHWAEHAEEHSIERSPGEAEPSKTISQRMIRSFWGAAPLTEFRLVLQRDVKEMRVLYMTSIIILFNGVFTGLLLGFVFFQIQSDQTGIRNSLSLLILVGLQIIGMCVGPVLSIFPTVRNLLVKDRYSDSIRISLVLLSRYLVNLPVRMVAFAVLACIVYYIVNTNALTINRQA